MLTCGALQDVKWILLPSLERLADATTLLLMNAYHVDHLREFYNEYNYSLQ